MTHFPPAKKVCVYCAFCAASFSSFFSQTTVPAQQTAVSKNRSVVAGLLAALAASGSASVATSSRVVLPAVNTQAPESRPKHAPAEMKRTHPTLPSVAKLKPASLAAHSPEFERRCEIRWRWQRRATQTHACCRRRAAGKRSRVTFCHDSSAAGLFTNAGSKYTAFVGCTGYDTRLSRFGFVSFLLLFFVVLY